MRSAMPRAIRPTIHRTIHAANPSEKVPLSVSSVRGLRGHFSRRNSGLGKPEESLARNWRREPTATARCCSTGGGSSLTGRSRTFWTVTRGRRLAACLCRQRLRSCVVRIPSGEADRGQHCRQLDHPAGPDVAAVVQNRVAIPARERGDEKRHRPPGRDEIVDAQEERRVPVLRINLVAGVGQGERHAQEDGPCRQHDSVMLEISPTHFSSQAWPPASSSRWAANSPRKKTTSGAPSSLNDRPRHRSEAKKKTDIASAVTDTHAMVPGPSKAVRVEARASRQPRGAECSSVPSAMAPRAAVRDAPRRPDTPSMYHMLKRRQSTT